MTTLSNQFKQAITNIGAKRARAIKAHTEIRALLETDPYLRNLGVDTVLIGSYARRTGIFPGRDVDVFVKLTEARYERRPRRRLRRCLSRASGALWRSGRDPAPLDQGPLRRRR